MSAQRGHRQRLLRNPSAKFMGMSVTAKSCAILFAGICALPTVFASQRAAVANDGFPLQPGAYWTYRGNVKWTQPNSDKDQEENLDWRMEVVRQVRLGKYEIAVMKGGPEDLIWYEPGKPRRDYLIVRDGGT